MNNISSFQELNKQELMDLNGGMPFVVGVVVAVAVVGVTAVVVAVAVVAVAVVAQKVYNALS